MRIAFSCIQSVHTTNLSNKHIISTEYHVFETVFCYIQLRRMLITTYIIKYQANTSKIVMVLDMYILYICV